MKLEQVWPTPGSKSILKCILVCAASQKINANIQNFGLKKNLCKKKLGKKKIQIQKSLVPKILTPKTCGSTRALGPIKIWAHKILGQKKKSFSNKILGQDKILDKKI